MSPEEYKSTVEHHARQLALREAMIALLEADDERGAEIVERLTDREKAA